MKAVISDIHANLEALCEVFKDIEKQSVNEVICLGDIVGYGAEPIACVDFVMQRADKTLVGNHDFALLYGPIGFNPIAADVIRMTHEIMEPHVKDARGESTDCFEPHFYTCAHNHEDPQCLIMEHEEGYRWDFLKKLDSTIHEGNLLYVHASPLQPVYEYVYPDKFATTWNPERITQLMEKVDWLSFCGHTHHPCVISSSLKCYYPDKIGYTFTLEPEEKYIINVGSVGQPRDRDNRACYLLLDEENRTVTWRRIEYDIDTAIEKIESMCGKDSWCGYRLRFGK